MATTGLGIGVVICRPMGYESICAYRSVRAVAEAARSLGFPVLCFDYAGTGDSEDHDSRAEQIALWRDDVLAAVSELRRRCGVSSVVLLGFRLGASLAALAASQSKHVAALIAIAPVLSGRRYLRELRTSRLLSIGDSPIVLAAEVNARAEDASGEEAGSVEASGAKLSAATVAALSQLQLEQLSGVASDILIVDRADIPAAGPWSEHLTRLGARVQYTTTSGFVQMMMTAPHLGAVSTEMVGIVREWLDRLRRSRGAARGAMAPAGDDGSVVLRFTGLPAPEAVLERPVFFSSSPPLFGIVTEPAREEVRRRGVILLNSAADYHIGPIRLYVSLARRWSRQGYVVLRMDFAGIGDSGTREGRPSNEVFPPGAVDDISAAVEFLREHYGVRDLTVAGMCSGAYHALQAAIAGLPINRILMINPRNYFWKQGMKLDDVQLWEAAQYPSVYQERVRSAHYWRRLLTGQVDIRRVLRIYGQRLWLMLEPLLRNAARRMHIRLADDLGSELEAIAARDVHIVFAFARGDGGDELLRILAGSSLKRLGKRCRVHFVDGADHGFSRAHSRATLERILSDELYSRENTVPRLADAAATLGVP
jgi:alpha-beta hydrolase superfamily lysophospholipase